MTLDESIEINTINNEHNPDYTDAERHQAHQLGIEASERLKGMRKFPYLQNISLLPSETDTSQERRVPYYASGEWKGECLPSETEG